MRRVPKLIMWCVGLGTITAVLIAWLCALWCKPTSVTEQYVCERPSALGSDALDSWTWNRRRGLGVRWLWIEPGIFRTEPPDVRRDPPEFIARPAHASRTREGFW
jgi:hypothetical protein